MILLLLRLLLYASGWACVRTSSWSCLKKRWSCRLCSVRGPRRGLFNAISPLREREGERTNDRARESERARERERERERERAVLGNRVHKLEGASQRAIEQERGSACEGRREGGCLERSGGWGQRVRATLCLCPVFILDSRGQGGAGC